MCIHFLFFKNAKCPPASGPLCMLFPLPGSVFPQMSTLFLLISAPMLHKGKSDHANIKSPSPCSITQYFLDSALIFFIMIVTIIYIIIIKYVYIYFIYQYIYVTYICITKTCTYTYTCTYIHICYIYSFQVAQVVKNLPVNTRDVRNMGLIPESGRFPGGRHGNPFEYSWLGESRGAWQVTIHRAAKSFI